jgi:hypothetical protein
MSYAKRAAQAAARIVNEKPGRKGKKGVVQNILSNDKELRQMIDHLPKELHRRVCTAAVKAAAEIVEKEASKEIASVGRRNIPYTGKLGNSRKTGTRESWSKKMAASRVGPAGNDMSKAVTRKMLKYKRKAPSTAIVGTDYYQYNFGHIHEPRVGEGPAEHIMWGDWTGKDHMKRPWLTPAAKSTIPLQRQAMITIIKARMKGFFK